jgi:CarD family transcriptional regulator
MEFSVGQHIVHPKYGVGVVSRIETAELLGRSSRCLKIHFPRHNTQILVPVDKAAELHMRAPLAPKQTTEIWDALKRRARGLARLRPRERVKIFKPIVAHGTPEDLATVVRDLGRLGRVKRLTDEESEMLETALRTLTREIALAEDRDPIQVRAEIEGILDR